MTKVSEVSRYELKMSGGIQKLIGPAKFCLEQCMEWAEGLLKTKAIIESDLDG